MTAHREGNHIGPYQIVRLLGEGGMGVVYEAVQEPIGRRVALKVLLPEYAHNSDVVTRFFNEARAVNVIEHPSLVQVSDFGRASDGTAYLVMEFLRGESLESRLKHLLRDGQRMPTSAALLIAVQMAAALAAAHAKGIVHRDLKPANVMLVLDPVAPGGERAKILDFGIAKLTQHQGKGTNTNALLGTPRYMSPEQCRGAGEVDDRTDVYALGVMLYEMLAGQTPFLGEGHGDFIGQHMFKEPPSLSGFAPTVPVHVVTLVHRLLIKDRSQRPEMREAEADLSRALSTLSGSLPTSQPPRDLDATRHLANVASPSTLGQSLGQTRRSGAGTPGARVLVSATFMTVAVLLVGGFYGGKTRGWWMTQPTAMPSATKPPAMPSATKPPARALSAPPTVQQVPDRHVPILAVSPDMASVEVLPATVPRQPLTPDVQATVTTERARPSRPVASAGSAPGPAAHTRPLTGSASVPVRPVRGDAAGAEAIRPAASQPMSPQEPKPKKLDPYDL